MDSYSIMRQRLFSTDCPNKPSMDSYSIMQYWLPKQAQHGFLQYYAVLIAQTNPAWILTVLCSTDCPNKPSMDSYSIMQYWLPKQTQHGFLQYYAVLIAQTSPAWILTVLWGKGYLVLIKQTSPAWILTVLWGKGNIECCNTTIFSTDCENKPSMNSWASVFTLKIQNSLVWQMV